MALALNKSEEVLARKNKSLANFTYDDSEMAQLFKNSLSEVTFLGFSVRAVVKATCSLVPGCISRKKIETKNKTQTWRASFCNASPSLFFICTTTVWAQKLVYCDGQGGVGSPVLGSPLTSCVGDWCFNVSKTCLGLASHTEPEGDN